MRRLLRFLRLALEHGSAFKSMAKLGPRAFGPKCPTCSLPQTQFMLPAHRAALKALNDGRSPESLEYVCRCPYLSEQMRPVDWCNSQRHVIAPDGGCQCGALKPGERFPKVVEPSG